MGIGSHISERRLIDELGRMGMNESIVSVYTFPLGSVWLRLFESYSHAHTNVSKFHALFRKYCPDMVNDIAEVDNIMSCFVAG